MSLTSSRSSSSRSEALLGGAGMPPILYVCISCEGIVQCECVLPEVFAAKRALRHVSVRAERGLQRGISFASKEEQLARGSRTGGDVRLPSCLTAHVLRRHGHAFAVLTLPDFEAEFASRCCEEVCELYGGDVLSRAQSRGGGAPIDDAEAPSSAAAGSSASGGANHERGSTCSATDESSQSSAAGSRWTFWRGRGARRDAPPTGVARADAVAQLAARLEELIRAHGKPERLAQLRRVRQVQQSTREVVSVMEENIDRILATGQNVDALEDKSEYRLRPRKLSFGCCHRV